jgi:hypothetical protein
LSQNLLDGLSAGQRPWWTLVVEIRVTRAYFDATPTSSDEAVAAELSRHAVFRLIPSTLKRHENG